MVTRRRDAIPPYMACPHRIMQALHFSVLHREYGPRIIGLGTVLLAVHLYRSYQWRE